jgi:hypothetical protein
VTEAQLIKKDWWWRRGGPDWTFNHESFTTESPASDSKTGWKSGIERAAFFYELLRRHDRSLKLAPYPMLSAARKDDLIWILGDTLDKKAVRCSNTPIDCDPKIWDASTWSELLPLQFDLKATNNAICIEVIALVNRHREAKKIWPPEKSTKSNRPLSWRWVELHDIDFYGVRPLKDNERSSLTRARRLAKSVWEYNRDRIRGS